MIIFGEYMFQFIKTWGFFIFDKLNKSVQLKTLMIRLTNFQPLCDLLRLLHAFLRILKKTVNNNCLREELK